MINLRRALVLVSLLTLTACSSVRLLAPTPNLFANGNYPQSGVPAAYQTTQSQIFFVTDRAAETKKGKLNYTAERSSSMVFGASTVAFGESTDWQALAAASGTVKRAGDVPLKLLETKEILRFDSTPTPFRVVNGKPKPDSAALASYKKKQVAFQEQVRAQMRRAQKNEVTIFVHGFNNTLEDGITSLADIWHFSGRSGVPIAYSWPAGSGGLTGYFTDRESGEFTVFHLKEFLRQLSEIPELKKIHIVAHSRGTDVTTTALRELIIAVRNQGRDPKKVLKIANLVLAAPDLDFSVVRQRLIAEGFGASIGQITVYMNRGDTALGIAQSLMAGRRFGTLTEADLQDAERQIFSEVKSVNFINVEGVKGFTGHAYFRTNRNVLSDIAQIIRLNARPGSVHRPLRNIEGNFWSMPERYPAQ